MYVSKSLRAFGSMYVPISLCKYVCLEVRACGFGRYRLVSSYFAVICTPMPPYIHTYLSLQRYQTEKAGKTFFAAWSGEKSLQAHPNEQQKRTFARVARGKVILNTFGVPKVDRYVRKY